MVVVRKGVLFYMSDQSSKNQKINLLIVATIALVVGFGVGVKKDYLWSVIAPTIGIEVEPQPDWQSLSKIYRAIKNRFDGEVDPQTLLTGAKKGVVAGLGDEHSFLMTEEESLRFNEQLSGDIGGGIGAEIGVRDGNLTIVRSLKNNPASRVGLLAGDVILKVNDEDVVGQALEPVVMKIRGAAGTEVRLTIAREGLAEPKEFTITRAIVDNPSVDWENRDGIMVVTIYRFDKNTSGLMQKAAHELRQAGAKGIVLDLRGNTGGYLDAAQNVAGLWLDGKLVTIQKRRGKVEEQLISPRGKAELANVPTIVLVDGFSASASEILAGALKEHGKATLIGTKTYGKGSVQELFPFDGGELKLTIAHWYTPFDTTIEGVGIKPDIEVKITAEDIAADRDPQLDRALTELK